MDIANVLIADDSRVLQERLAALLADIEGVKIVGQTFDTDETIQSIQELRPNVIILDIRMPGGGGIRVLEEVKRGTFLPMVIVLTNCPYPQYRKKCMEEGASFFLDKSTEFEKVIDILRGTNKQENLAPVLTRSDGLEEW